MDSIRYFLEILVHVEVTILCNSCTLMQSISCSTTTVFLLDLDLAIQKVTEGSHYNVHKTSLRWLSLCDMAHYYYAGVTVSTPHLIFFVDLSHREDVSTFLLLYFILVSVGISQKIRGYRNTQTRWFGTKNHSVVKIPEITFTLMVDVKIIPNCWPGSACLIMLCEQIYSTLG